MKSNLIKDKWIKASIIGTFWAASEIVLGSFIHNLKIPFGSNLLTAIGIIIMISASFLWKEKGLIIRAGIICSLMKSMSPSAIILGPMVAIFMQALFFELTTTFIGKNTIGFIIGGMLAMTWNLLHKILNLMLVYGMNLYEIYKQLILFLQKQLGVNYELTWYPIYILIGVYALFGLFAALIGIYFGKKVLHQKNELNIKFANTTINSNNEKNTNKNTTTETSYSFIWLFTNLACIVTGIVLINYIWILGFLFTILCLILWLMKYKNALKRLAKPKFWLFFIVITILSTLLITQFFRTDVKVEDGVIFGLQMNFRAALIIVGFSVIGRELNNPRIKNYFLHSRFKQLHLAFDASFESLPFVIANIPEYKKVLKHPFLLVNVFYAYANERIKELNKKSSKCFIITADKDAGKTTTLKAMIDFFKQQYFSIGGIYTEKIYMENEILGYDVVNIETNERKAFLRKNGLPNQQKIGCFFIDEAGLDFGKQSLDCEKMLKKDLVVIDEVGKLEIDNNGWASNIELLLANTNVSLIVCVRKEFVKTIIEKWKLMNCFIYDVGAENKNNWNTIILDFLNSK